MPDALERTVLVMDESILDLALRRRTFCEPLDSTHPDTQGGVGFSPHWFRHTYATWLLRRGAGMESVKELLGHASITTTVDTYGHLTVEDARATLEAAGWFSGTEVRL